MKNILFSIAMVFSTIISYGQSKEVYVSPEVDKLVTVGESGSVILSFQNRKYEYVQDLESCVLGSVPKTIQILQKALEGLNDNEKDEQVFSSFDIMDFGSKAGVVVSVGSKYTILTPKELKTIITNLKS